MSGRYEVVPSAVMSDRFEIAWRDKPRSLASAIDWVGIIFADHSDAQWVADMLNKRVEDQS